MTENRPAAAREDGGQAGAMPRDSGVSHRVDPTMNPMQAIGHESSADRCRRIAQPQELWMGNHPMLLLRQLRQLPMRSYFFPHTGNKCDLNEGSPRGNICSPP
jgi:hypothetical protein